MLLGANGLIYATTFEYLPTWTNVTFANYYSVPSVRGQVYCKPLLCLVPLPTPCFTDEECANTHTTERHRRPGHTRIISSR